MDGYRRARDSFTDFFQVNVSLPDGEGQIKIADFGSASLLEPSRLKELGITNLGLTQTGELHSSSLTGTLMYLPPEVLCGESPTASADVYALGVMLHVCQP
jgi:serine/threonine protein kinase